MFIAKAASARPLPTPICVDEMFVPVLHPPTTCSSAPHHNAVVSLSSCFLRNLSPHHQSRMPAHIFEGLTVRQICTTPLRARHPPDEGLALLFLLGEYPPRAHMARARVPSSHHTFPRHVGPKVSRFRRSRKLGVPLPLNPSPPSHPATFDSPFAATPRRYRSSPPVPHQHESAPTTYV